MNYHSKQINQISTPRRRKEEDSTDTKRCVTGGDPWTAKQHHWKSEAKEERNENCVQVAREFVCDHIGHDAYRMFLVRESHHLGVRRKRLR